MKKILTAQHYPMTPKYSEQTKYMTKKENDREQLHLLQITLKLQTITNT